jgi:hypothetical protein
MRFAEQRPQQVEPGAVLERWLKFGSAGFSVCMKADLNF